MIGKETGVILSGNMRSLTLYNMKSNKHIIVFKRCVCHIIVILFRELRNFSTYCHPGQDQNTTVEPCTPPPHRNGHRKYGCIFSLIPTTWTMQIINTKPRSLDLCAGKSKYWHNVMAALYLTGQILFWLLCTITRGGIYHMLCFNIKKHKYPWHRPLFLKGNKLILLILPLSTVPWCFLQCSH